MARYFLDPNASLAMSYRLPASAVNSGRPLSSAPSSSGSSASDDQDRAECDNFDNFDELDQAQEVFSLFDQHKAFPSVAEAIRYDDREHGWDLEAEVARLGATGELGPVLVPGRPLMSPDSDLVLRQRSTFTSVSA